MTSRWWSAWILFITLLGLLVFYFVWLPLSYYGKIVAVKEEMRLSELRSNEMVSFSKTSSQTIVDAVSATATVSAVARENEHFPSSSNPMQEQV